MSEKSDTPASPARPRALGFVLGIPRAVGRFWARLGVFGIALYYLAILIALIILHGRGGLETPKFIYQGF